MAGDTIAPPSLALSPQQITALIRERFNLKAEQIVPMDSELSTVARADLADGRSVAFKAMHYTSEAFAGALWRTQAMEHLQSVNIPVGSTVPDINGELLSYADTPHGPVMIHLGEWLCGIPLERSAFTSKLLNNVGSSAAAVSLSLEGWPPPPVPVSHSWELTRTLESLDETLATIPNPETLHLLQSAEKRFTKHVENKLENLPHSVVHHDLHDSNLLIDPNRETVSGILDFGDMVVAPRIAELVVSAGYGSRGAPNPVEAFLNVTRGWGATLQLQVDEAAVLFDAAIGRLAVNLAIWTARSQGDRASYALSRSATTARALEALLAADRSETINRIMIALKLPSL